MRPHVWCEFRSLLWFCARVHGALESKSHQQLDRCMAATVWAARHHSNSPMHHSLSPLAAWKPLQWTRAWRHRLKPKRRNMFIRNQQVMSTSWNGIWLKYGQQPAELHWPIDRSVTRLFYCVSQSQKQTLCTFATIYFYLLLYISIWYVTDRTFKAYTTAFMNKLTYVSFHKVGQKQPSGEAVNFVAVYCKFTKVSVCLKLWKYYEVWQSYRKNNKGAIFLPHSVVGWFHGTVVECWSLTGELSLSCARPAADG